MKRILLFKCALYCNCFRIQADGIIIMVDGFSVQHPALSNEPTGRSFRHQGVSDFDFFAGNVLFRSDSLWRRNCDDVCVLSRRLKLCSSEASWLPYYTNFANLKYALNLFGRLYRHAVESWRLQFKVVRHLEDSCCQCVFASFLWRRACSSIPFPNQTILWRDS